MNALTATLPEITECRNGGKAIQTHDSLELAALCGSLHRNQQPETGIKPVDRLAIQLEQMGGLCGCQIETKALQDFFDPVLG